MTSILKYTHLFFDLDHTLWDFDANAREVLHSLWEDESLATKATGDFEYFHRTYLHHNEQLWARYRRGAITQSDLRYKRMRLTLMDMRIADEALAHRMAQRFLEWLPTRTRLFPDTLLTLDYLQGRGYALHLITNGFEEVQHSKLRHSGLHPYFAHVITSEGSQSLKPHPEIFHYALQKTGASLSESLMIGDTWDADVTGALGVGMDVVYANYTGADQGTDAKKATYTIGSIGELQRLL